MATRYPEDWIEELRGRADILQIVSEYVPLKQKGRSHWGLCPFHGEKTPSFKVDPDQGLYYCFGCKAGGSVFQFIMDAERMEFSEAVHYLAEKVHMPLPKTQVDEAELERSRTLREKILALNRRAAHLFHETLYTKDGEHVLSYLHERGLDDPAIRMFGIGAAPTGWDTLTRRLTGEGATPEELVLAGITVQKGDRRFDMFRNRAIFPIINAHGAVLGFGGRAMGDAQPKYLNTADTPAFNKRHNVYAANLLRKARGLSRVLLVEGYMDVVSLVRNEIKGVAATLGTSLTPEQAKLLKRYAPEIWVAYDGDSAGQNATLLALDVLESLDIPAKVLAFPGGMDPDDFIRQSGREAFDALQPLSAPMYRMHRAKDGLELSTEEGRTRYAIACAAILKRVRQPVELENLLKRLMVDTGYSREVLIQQIGISVPAQPTGSQKPRRERKPAAATGTLFDHMTAERLLLSLMNMGMVPEGMTIEAERFTEPTHRIIAQGFLDGKSPAEMLDMCEEDETRRTMLDVFGNEPQVTADEQLRVVTDCLERMRRGWIDDRIRTLIEMIQTASGADKTAAFQEIESLNKEKERLRPGRKE